MFPLPGIVLVDNEERELNQLREAFFKSGLPCLPLLYSNDPENATGLDHFDKPDNLKVRLLFTDLNLKDLARLTAIDLVSPIANVIQKLVPSGPYIIIFWSPHKDEASEVVTLLEQRFSDTTTLPLAFATIDKANYQLTQDPVKNEQVGIQLREKIHEVIQSDPLFHALLDWEGRIAEASRATFQTLYEVAKPQTGTHSLQLHKDNLVQLLSAMAQESVGRENAKQIPAFAIDQVMLPIMEDRLSHVRDRIELDKLWKKSLPNLGSAAKPEKRIRATLNTFLHIDSITEGLTKSFRGVFVELHPDFSADAKLMKHLGNNRHSILSEFLNADNKVEGKTIEDARSLTKLGFLEISAECDYAQQNDRLYKYIVGALIPAEYHAFTKFNNREFKHEAIYLFPPILFKSKGYLLRLNFRQQIGAHAESRLLGPALFRVRDQILADIIFRCSQQSARPGIIAFR